MFCFLCVIWCRILSDVTNKPFTMLVVVAYSVAFDYLIFIQSPASRVIFA